MRSYVAAFVVALVVAALLTPIMRPIGLRFGAVSRPGGRHVHQHSIPRLGGIGIAIGFAAPLALLFIVNGTVAAAMREAPPLLLGLLVGGRPLGPPRVAPPTPRAQTVAHPPPPHPL